MANSLGVIALCNFFLNAEKGQKKVCVHTISLTNGWNLTKLISGVVVVVVVGGGGGGWWGGLVTLTLFSRSLHYKY